jgi:peptide/nickel transport system ATP-binding protein
MEWMLHEDAGPAEASLPPRNLFKRVTFDVSALPQSAADSLAPVPNAGPVLSVSNLVTSFLREGEWNAVVRGVSFDVGPKETVAIVGESGSGKSVTALSIMRLIPPQSGRVEGSIKLAGRELTTLPEKAMHHVRGNEVAMIFQEPMTSLNPVLTIGFQIAEALIYHRGLSRQEAEAETVRLLEKVRIPAAKSRFHEYPHRFSGGMRQRVMIAMALACRPKLLIADEPTTALDVTIQAQILELIKELQEEEDMSVLFITHDMGVVAEIADRTVVMYHGKAVEAGATEQIFAAPAHPYTKALLSAVPQLGSMKDISRPMRFPIVDKTTGESDVPVETPDTVKIAERPVLEVSGLTTRFDIHSGLFGKVSGRVHAVENVSFSLHSGETLALVGESGCGKSTTGRSILRLIEPNAGSVLIDGEDVLAMDGPKLRDMRKRMQIIFQDPFASLNPRMSIGSAIAEPFYAHGLATGSEARDRVADLLTRVGLSPDMASRYPHEFSGGQRQRICIARALALGPKLIVADEAVSALDVSVKAQVVNLMLDLQASMGLAYLFISHDIAVVERMCHRVAVMYLGEIVEIGPRAAVFGNAQHPYTKKLMSAVPIPDPARRLQKRGVSNDEIKSPVRSPDYVPPVRQYREVSPGHVVMAWE